MSSLPRRLRLDGRLMAGALLLPQLGGTVPGGTPPPAGTPGTGGGGGSGGGSVTTPEQYATYLVLLSAAVFAVIGLFQGAKRSLTSFTFTFGAAFLIGTRWAMVAGMVNRMYKMFLFALKGGPLSGDPAAAWASVKDVAPLVPLEGSAATFWQLVFFSIAVLVGFGLGHILFDAPGGNLLKIGAFQDWLSRMFGALFGSLTGTTIAVFVLPRIVPGAKIDMVGPGSVMRNLVDQYGQFLFWSFVILMIVAGLLALRPRPANKVFN